jgi:N-acetylneuraminic acid mutarotase
MMKWHAFKILTLSVGLILPLHAQERGTPAETLQVIAKPTAIADLPRAVSSLGATIADGYLYVYGGHAGKTHSYDTQSVLGTFQRASLAGGGWENLPAGPILQGMNLVSYQGKIIRVGGMQPKNAPGEKADNFSVNTVAQYDPATRLWTELAPLPEGRSSHDCVVVGTQLIVAGGWQSRGNVEKTVWAKTLLTLDLADNKAQWQAVPQPFERRAITMAGFEGKVYIIGGINGAMETEKTVSIYDPKTKQWTTGPDFPGAGRIGFSPAACATKKGIVLNTSDGKIHLLIPSGNAWKTLGEVENRRMVHRLANSSDETVYVIGGANPQGNVAGIEKFQLPSSH